MTPKQSTERFISSLPPALQKEARILFNYARLRNTILKGGKK